MGLGDGEGGGAVRFGRHGVVTATAPGMAAANPPGGEPASRQGAMFTDRRNRVLRAGGGEAAAAGRTE